MDPLSHRIEQLTPLQQAVLALKETRAKLEALEQASHEPIAIVGMACRFPGGAHCPRSFWRIVCDGVDAITEIPSQRWDADAFYDPDPQAPGKMNSRWGGFLDRIEEFDNAFFGISEREAVHLDPQQRLLMELGYEALEDAGIPSDALRGSQTGVFVGISVSDYGIMLYSGGGCNGFVATGNHLSVAANRLSFALDFRGPSVSLDTACSSSLVAAHLACQSIRGGESQLALVGGVNVILSPYPSIDLTKAGFSSPGGRCRSFDGGADGYVRSEGGGMVVLKPLHQALADHDSVYAVIRGSAVGQDGHSNGLTAPHRQAQEAVLRAAYDRAKVSPGDVQFVETQGTGTLFGDAVEALALGNVLTAGRPPGSICALGSVKTNLGHLEAASGIAGLIKTVLALRHRQLPPNLHFRTPNPSIPFDTLPLRVQQSLEPWPAGRGLALAGVSAFGFGGTLAHIVLEEAPAEPVAPPAPEASATQTACLIPLSARSEDALRDLARAYADRLCDGSVSLDDLSYTTCVRRNHHRHRLALAVGSCQEARELLAAFGRGELPLAHSAGHGACPGDRMAAGCKPFDRQPKLAFLFCGDAVAWQPHVNALGGEPAFRRAIADWHRRIEESQGWSLDELLGAPRDDPRWQDPAVALPALLALQTSLVDTWQAAGITPDLVVAASGGEPAAALAAGILAADDTLEVAVDCGRRLAGAAPGGKRETVDVRKARLPLLLEVGGEVHPADALDPSEWHRPAGETASARALAAGLQQHHIDTVLEIGPPALGRQIAEHLRAGNSECLALASLADGDDPGVGLHGALPMLYVRGHRIDWRRMHGRGGTSLRLPTYPWQRKRFWVEPQRAAAGGDAGLGARGSAIWDSLATRPQPPAPSPQSQTAADPLAWTDSGPVGQRPDLDAPYVAPQTELQRYLADLWAKTLHVARVGIYDNFLELGGNSLQAAAMINRLQQQINVTVSPVALFETQTVSELADYLQQEHPTAVGQLLLSSAGGTADGVTAADDRQGSATSSALSYLLHIPAFSQGADPQELRAQIAELSDDDVDALLRQSLADRERDDE